MRIPNNETKLILGEGGQTERMHACRIVVGATEQEDFIDWIK